MENKKTFIQLYSNLLFINAYHDKVFKKKTKKRKQCETYDRKTIPNIMELSSGTNELSMRPSFM